MSNATAYEAHLDTIHGTRWTEEEARELEADREDFERGLRSGCDECSELGHECGSCREESIGFEGAGEAA
jgi:hypothetical protein